MRPPPNCTKSVRLGIVLFLAGFAGCAAEEAGPEYDRDVVWESLDLGDEAEFDAGLESLRTVPIDPPPRWGEDYDPVFPDPIPFDPSEWQTGVPADIVADPKGGRIVLATQDWPATIRTDGPNSRLNFLFQMHSLIYETLVTFDMSQDAYVPGLATHWQIGEDKMTFRFRIDERARWADGREVTADDVVATVEHMRNLDRKDAFNYYYREIIEYAKMLDKYTVEVKAREPKWRNFMTVGWSFMIYPAAYIRMDGETYVQDWNWKLPPGTGPYELRTEDIRKGRSITLRRRKDWWARDFPENRHAYNFDEIEWQVVRDEELLYQKVLAGEIDSHYVNIAQRWVEELEKATPVALGWVQKRKIYSLVPKGYDGFVMNMRKAPFDERSVRLAFAHLLNREKLFAKFFFFEYEYLDTYYPASEYARPNAERIRYDPERARKLLAEAGWVRRDDEGYLVNEKGERFPTLTMDFTGESTAQRIFEVYMHDLWNEAGIRLELRVLDYSAISKRVWEYRFSIKRQNWTASLFPSPKTMWHSSFADRPQSNNLPGFKNAEADRIIDAYEYEFDPKKRRKMLQRLDELFFDAHPYALGWYGPYFRLIYWDKFGHPPEYFSRHNRGYSNVLQLWWYDEERAKHTLESKKLGRKNHPGPLGQYDEIEHRYWLYNRLSMKDGE
ncbi:MAG: ABC transporter substrate-binding protein [Planctomycetota bacterium]|jgi:ABC-type transport system substrate-binding protein